ncbi:GNAT family N-acetyltransferase [Sulfobacillus sp. DSM 109850]|uniref:GNAT family N-acetyltransferase n=1 Tax=Sulfobacillus harzensis TaxID=2729629 RepID=A0A7Y0L8P6_9FIRM|nr:GNAT family N-acetyltransferase [Sulfobacillus harzensis]
MVDSADYIGAWLPFAKHTRAVEDTLAFIDTTLRSFAAGSEVNAGIWYQDKLVGTIGLHINRSNQSASIGYWIGQAYEGRGIMTRSCRALITYAFGELALHRIEIRANMGNTRSRAIPERLGFQQEGIIREAFKLDDEFNDSVVYGLLDREWPR